MLSDFEAALNRLHQRQNACRTIGEQDYYPYIEMFGDGYQLKQNHCLRPDIYRNVVLTDRLDWYLTFFNN